MSRLRLHWITLLICLSLFPKDCHAGSLFEWLFPRRHHSATPNSAPAPPATAPSNTPAKGPLPYVAPHMHKCMSIVLDSQKHTNLWNHARKVAKRRYPIPKETVFTPTMWFSQHHNVRVFNITNVPMQYRINWKGGSSNMVANLEEIQKKTGGYLPAYRYVHDNTDTESILISKGFGYKSLHNMKSFTYVREPFGHFLAGLREYYFRLYRAKFTLTPEFLERDLYDMLDTNMTFLPSTLHSVMHVFPQAGILSFNANPGFIKYPHNLPTFVGKLEQFDDDWKKINKMYKLNVTLDKAVAVHPTQVDPNKVKDAFAIVMTRNEPLRNALCVLLHIDYICFEYELPDYCKDVVKSVFGK